MICLSLHSSTRQGRASGNASSQRHALNSPTSAVRSPVNGPLEGPRSWPSPASASWRGAACCSAAAERQDPPDVAPMLWQSPLNSAGEDCGSECCGSGRCCHGGRFVGIGPGTAGGRHWRLVPRDLMIGTVLAAPICTAAAAAQAAAEDATAAAAAAVAATAADVAAAGGVDVTVAELAAAGVTSVVPPGYVPSPVEPGWEIWLGFVAGVVPFLIGSYEFGKRIIIQLRCEQCGGRGLVPSSGPGRDKYLRKCPQCGGFFPWISWNMFLTSAAAPGNGGPLQQPRGQTSVFYSVPDRPDPAKQAEALARSQAAIEALQTRGQRAAGQQQQARAGEESSAPALAGEMADGGVEGATQEGRDMAEARAGAVGDDSAK